eukprot:7309702-Alexandrium_andersonii.AAC.1
MSALMLAQSRAGRSGATSSRPIAKSQASGLLGGGSEEGCEVPVSETAWRGLFLAFCGQSAERCPT